MSKLVCAVLSAIGFAGAAIAALGAVQVAKAESGETLYLAPKSVTDLGNYKYDVQDPDCWTNGLPKAGMTAVFQRGAATAYATNSAPIYAQNLKFIGADFYLKTWDYPVVLDSDTFSTVSGSSAGFKLLGPLQAKAPVRWTHSGSEAQFFSLRGPAVFEDELELRGQLEVSGNDKAGNTLDVPVLTGYPGGNQTAAMTITCGTKGGSNPVATITNTARFGGLFGINRGTLRTPGGDPVLNDPAVTAELVTDGLAVRFDASDESSFTFTNGNRIAEWRDSVGGVKAVPLFDGQFPWWRERELGLQAAVDFGGVGGSTINSAKAYTAPLKFETSVSGVKTVFYVLDSSHGGGWLFAAETDVKRNFHRVGSNPGASCGDAWISTSYNQNPNATMRVNGRDVDIFATTPGGTYEILTLANAGASFKNPIAGFAFDYLSGALYDHCGNQRIAEFLAYGRALSADEVKRVEKYLYRKWFAGRNDLRQVVAKDSATLDVPVSASEGHEVHLAHFNGRSHLVKKGAGNLVVDHPRDIPERIEANEGTLVFESDDPLPRRIGIVPALPEEGVILHLDASDASSFTLDETGDVTEWRDLSASANRLVPGKDGSTVGWAPTPRPHILTGKTMVDFGGNATVCFMNLETRITTARTVLYAIDARYGGAHLLSDVSTTEKSGAGADSFHRGNCSAGSNVYASFDLGCSFGSNGGELWNGFNTVSTERDTPAGVPQVLVWTGRSGNRTIGRIGMDRDKTARTSGLAVGELVVYDRVLTDTEIAQAVAFLEAKWLDRTTPPVRNLDATGDATVETRADSLVVDTLSGSGSLTAKGGTITVKGLADFNGILRSAEGGVWDIRHDRGAAPTSNPVTEGLIAHFDPSDATRVTADDAGKLKQIVSVNDPDLVATAPTSKEPTLDGSDQTVGNLPLINCGGNNDNKGLQMSTSFTNVHTAICVYKPVKNSGGQLFGSPRAGTQPFLRDSKSSTYPIFKEKEGTKTPMTGVLWGETWRDGRYIKASFEGFKNAAQVLSFIWPRRVYVEYLGFRDTMEAGGGQAYGEVLLWNRCLTDAERKSVEAYLSAKWFGKPIHGYTVEGQPDVPGYETSGSPTDYAVARGETLGLGYLMGDAGIEKSGEGTLELDGSTSELAGTLTVKSGTLAYGTTPADETVLPVTAGLVAQFEAGVNMETNEAGRVTAWRPKAAAAEFEGYVATPPKATGTYPKYEADALNGRGAIDFGPYGSSGCGLWFDPTAHPDHLVIANSKNYGVLPNCCTILLMFNSEQGGGYVIGNLGDNYYHRNTSPPNSAGNVHSALFSNSVSPLREVIVDSVSVGKTQQDVLNGAWQMIEVYKTGKCDVAGFAHDRCQSYSESHGGQKLAEAVFFDHVLTDEEKLKMRLYFYNKWYDRIAPGTGRLNMMYQSNAGRVEVAEGATFDLNGYRQNTATLVCAGGTVANGDLKVADRLEYVPGETLTVKGAVIFGEAGTIEMSSDWQGETGVFKVISATAVGGVENLRRWKTKVSFNGQAYRASLEVRGGDVYLRIAGGGLIILFR